jgi:hypothetical protein
MNNLDREIAKSDETIPYIPQELEIDTPEIHLPMDEEEWRESMKDIFIWVKDPGQEESGIGEEGTEERFRKKGRPTKEEKEKVQKVSLSLSAKTRNTLKEIYGDEISTSSAINEMSYRYYLHYKQKQLQVEAVKKELMHIAHLLENYDSKKREMKLRVQNFLKIVRFLGFTQKVYDPKNPTTIKVEDSLASALDSRTLKLYQFCQHWEMNGYPESLF